MVGYLMNLTCSLIFNLSFFTFVEDDLVLFKQVVAIRIDGDN